MSGLTEEPAIDPDAIATFVNVVYGYLDGQVPIRLIPETGTPHRSPVTRFCAVSEAAETLAALAPEATREQRGLFVVPGTTRQAGRVRAEDVSETGVLLVDIDDGDIPETRNRLARLLGEPSLEVASGGTTSDGLRKLHLYWKLTEAVQGADLERVRQLRETVAVAFGTDPAFRSLHQPIRVPGSIHGKQGKRSPVELLSASGREYDLGDLEEALAGLPDPTPAAPALTPRMPAGGVGGIVRQGGVDGITRFAALSSVIGTWVRQVRLGRATLDEAWQEVRSHNLACILPPWDEARLHREFEALRRLDADQSRASSGPMSKLVPGSDDALAAAFVDAEGADWCFVPGWQTWLQWSGTHWQEDRRGLVRDRVRHVCRAAGANPGLAAGQARRIASNKTIQAVLAIAAADPALARSPEDWDEDPMQINTPAGLLDLRSGTCLPHDRRQALTRITRVAQGDKCPGWQDFLSRITDGDADLQAYLKRLAGYCLTGETSEQVFTFLHGAGANGKSVFLSTLGYVLGSYAATAALGTFTRSRSDRHLTELAGLRAARLVMVPETEAGRAWDETRIKTVTGGERVRANLMRQDHFEFTPRFKLLIAGNHRPALHGVGEAMRRRLHVVPFGVTIPTDERDPDLPGNLRREAPGILNWMIEGCLDWQRMRLRPPEAVLAASRVYFEAEDIIGHWLDACCVLEPVAFSPAQELFRSWSDWANRSGHPVGTAKALGEALRDRGLSDRKVRGKRGWVGIRLRTQDCVAEDAA
jgi:P4 family phage/plasmid primase-like protien